MFQTIIKLYKTNKIIFGSSIIYCDQNNICSIYQECSNIDININTTCVKNDSIPIIVSSI
jgi:hypothetical protein